MLRRTADPVFNHTMVYDGIRDTDLSEACVELTVWDRDRLASNMLGGLRLGVGTGNGGRGPCQNTQTDDKYGSCKGSTHQMAHWVVSYIIIHNKIIILILMRMRAGLSGSLDLTT